MNVEKSGFKVEMREIFFKNFFYGNKLFKIHSIFKRGWKRLNLAFRVLDMCNAHCALGLL